VGEILKRTPLYGVHVAAGAKVIEFGGWEMPVQYSGIIEEHRAVRQAAGIFDLSHMGEFTLDGPGAEAFLQEMTTNDVSKLAVGQAHYSMFCRPTGGIVDDILVYRRPNGFFIVVNGANVDKDFAWLTAHLPAQPDFQLRNISDETALIAVQGPKAAEIVQRVVDTPLDGIYYYRFAEGKANGFPAIISRTGYTGEDGVELYVENAAAEGLWAKLTEIGGPLGMVPVGLGARDTLRLEMAYSLYGNDLTDETTPLEAGLGWVVKMNKGDFVGRAALERQKETGVARKLVGFELAERGIARHGYRLAAPDGATIGEVTSGTFSPTLEKTVGLGYVKPEFAAAGSEIAVDIRGKLARATVVQVPFAESHVRKC
jgi:aminomethyltransferase